MVRITTAGDLPGAIAAAFRHSPVQVVSVYLFGSRADGRAHRQSDVDIAVLLPPSDTQQPGYVFDSRVRLISWLIGELHMNDVDVVILNDAPPQFARRIVTHGRRVVLLDPPMDHAFVRDVQLRAADIEPFLKRARATKLAAIRAMSGQIGR